MKLSLIMASVDRTETVERFLESLQRQGTVDFELIVVDQNEDDRLAKVLASFSRRLNIRHVRSQRGLSIARNLGLTHASGEIIGWPDDDCWYHDGFLAWLLRRFDDQPPFDGVCVRCVDEQNRGVCVWWSKRGGRVNKFNAWFRCTSVSIFMRRRACDLVGPFDELLGAGAKSRLQSAEDIDYVLRAVERNCWIEYDPSAAVGHPDPTDHAPARSLAVKARRYGMACGHVLRRHRYPLWFVGCALLHPIVTGGAAMLRGRLKEVRRMGATFIGRLAGFCAASRH